MWRRRQGCRVKFFIDLKQSQFKGGSHGACVPSDPATDSFGLDAEVQWFLSHQMLIEALQWSQNHVLLHFFMNLSKLLPRAGWIDSFLNIGASDFL